jgi:hypothetical protein
VLLPLYASCVNMEAELSAAIQVDDLAVVDMVPFEPSFTRCAHCSCASHHTDRLPTL